MLGRILVALLLLGSIASFSYGFWLVLGDRPARTVAEDIPLTRETQAPRPEPAALSEDTSTDTPGTPPAGTETAALPATAPATGRDAGVPGPVVEPPISLALPIACDPGVDCWLVNYVDLDPGPGWRDYQCGRRSYDGHKGTDVGLANLARLDEDVPVLAALGGRVAGVRDGMEDVDVSVIGGAAVEGRECGNGVRIEHSGGWETQYCHLKKGSVIVSPGQMVETGQTLGAVGLSGGTEFPHIHLSVRRNGEVVDPFLGVSGGADCSLGIAPLWDDGTLAALTSVPAPALLDIGFADHVLSNELAESGQGGTETLPSDAEAIVLWMRATGIQPGDEAQVAITLPDGSPFFAQTLSFDRHQIMVFRAGGRRNSQENFPEGFPPGIWRGQITMSRDGVVTARRDVVLEVTDG